MEEEAIPRVLERIFPMLGWATLPVLKQEGINLSCDV